MIISSKSNFIYYILGVCLFVSCKDIPKDTKQGSTPSTSETDMFVAEDSMVYQTEHLTIQKLSDHTYVHTSFLETQDFGKVSCNGMVVINENEAIVFDTPATNESSTELINYVTKQLGSKIKAVIPTHFHQDCVGGLELFNEHDIPCFADTKTLALLKENDFKFIQSIHGFNDQWTSSLGDKKVFAEYFGEGHTKDNVIGYFPGDHVIFGGCLIKSMNASKGNLEDANTDAWSETVEKIKQKYPSVKIVIPGHGPYGGIELLDYTIALFQ